MNEENMKNFINEILNMGSQVSNLKEQMNELRDLQKESEKKIEYLEEKIKEQGLIEKVLKYSEKLEEKQENLKIQRKRIEELENHNQKISEDYHKEKEINQNILQDKQALEKKIEELSMECDNLKSSEKENKEKIIDIMGVNDESYETYKILYLKLKEKPWSEDAFMQMFVSDNFMTFFAKCGDIEKVKEFYKGIGIHHKDESYMKTADELLDFCLYACNKINDGSYRRQEVDIDDDYDYKIHRIIGESEGKKVGRIYLKGIMGKENVLQKCGSYVELKEV